MDPDRVRAALRFADSRLGFGAVAVRHGCLVGESPNAELNRTNRVESFSVAKSVTAMVTGRAMTLGLLSPDDRVGALIPEADRAHGDITVRQLLEMTSGLHFNLLQDVNLITPDIIGSALSLGFDTKPGTNFEYLESGVALLAEVVSRATRMDFQEFAQKELFGPLGIPRDRWDWNRDQKGRTYAFYGLHMQVLDFARLGQLMLDDGVWAGQRLLATWMVRAARTPTSKNPGYGWLFWTNAGSSFIAPTVTGRDQRRRRFLPAAPPDAYFMAGLFNQAVGIFPEQDLVVARFGLPSSLDPGAIVSLAAPGDGDYEAVRQVLGSITDATRPPDPGPYRSDGLPPISLESPGLVASLLRPDEAVSVLLPQRQPGRGPARARAVQMSPGAAPVGRTGTTAVRLRCPPVGQVPCVGTVDLRGPDGARLTTSVTFAIPKGTSARIGLSATRDLRGRLARRGARVPTAVHVTTDDTAGGVTTASPTTVVLRARR